jgi:4-amino-4-deoxy-L-arabinose transferase-like glycosyltransferase
LWSEQLNKVGISHIILMSLVLHVFVIAQPQNFQLWDESIFLELTRNFIKMEDHTPYQLPGSYLFAGTAITIFGDNWFSWRAPSVIFGMLTLLVFYKISCRFTTEKNALFATLILSFDTIFFIHSTLFVRDVIMMFFGMLSLYLYFSKKYYLAAVVLGFSFFIKETAVFFLIFIMMFYLVKNKPWKNKFVKKKPILFLAVVSGTFLAILWMYDVSFNPVIYDPMIPTQKSVDGRDIPIAYPELRLRESRGYVHQTEVGVVTNPIQHLDIFLNSGYVSSDAYKIKNWNVVHTNYPWSWILPLTPPEKGNSLGWVNGKNLNFTEDRTRQIGKVFAIKWNGDPNVPLWVIGFWGSIAFVLYGIKKQNQSTLFVGAGMISMYVPYLLLSITGRVMFPYYFIYTIPFVSLGIVLLIDVIKQKKLRILSNLILLGIVVWWFVLHYPLQILTL